MLHPKTYKWCLDTSATMLSKRWSLPERERMPVPLCQEDAFFFYACVIPFSSQGPLGVSTNLSFPFFFFLIQFKFFIYLFVPCSIIVTRAGALAQARPPPLLIPTLINPWVTNLVLSSLVESSDKYRLANWYNSLELVSEALKT